MNEDTKFMIIISLGMLLVAALLASLGYAVHLNSARADAARLECTKQGRVWVSLGQESTCMAAVK